MNLSKAIGLGISFWLVSQNSEAQDYFIRMETMKVRLYAGYINPVLLNIVHPGDTSTYIFHAQAEGASMDYDPVGRLQIVPYAKKGVVRVFAEKSGKFYTVSNELIFESVAAPVDDQTFIRTMGITPTDDKKRLKKPKKFTLPTGVTALDSDFYLNGVTVSELRTDEMNTIFITILKRDGGREYLVPQEGNIQVSSRDARVKKIDSRTFSISPSSNLKRCKLEISFDGKKIGEETLTVWNPGD